jgi:hypothetical protein
MEIANNLQSLVPLQLLLEYQPLLKVFSSAGSADWFYDTVEAIDDAGIAVSGVIVDGVNDIPAAIVDFFATHYLIALWWW